MENKYKLLIGDYSDNGQIYIVDEDRLCYIVKSTNRGATGLRTISKALLNEFINYLQSHPTALPREARVVLSGNSELDKYEYGYDSTLLMMAKMVLGMENVQFLWDPVHNGCAVLLMVVPCPLRSCLSE